MGYLRSYLHFFLNFREVFIVLSFSTQVLAYFGGLWPIIGSLIFQSLCNVIWLCLVYLMLFHRTLLVLPIGEERGP